MSFYRIYRPQIIEEIDNIVVREAILRLLGKPKKDLPHAYMFTGPRGGGKTTAARIIAKLFNCTHPSADSGPCGKCDQCVSIAEGRNLDVLEIDAASNRGIDEIRALRDGINLVPASADHKIYIIDEVHMLTTEAFNALLKTLEEPPAHAVFVLATTNPEKVPVTIKSRCVNISFAKASVEELIFNRCFSKRNINTP
jgi:DNA polymerase-3 subunit gamma/tau